MTLVLACLTRDAVYQVSDRRLTRLAYPHDTIDDDANKAVLLRNRVVFGYTGLARIGTERTDYWLTRVLAAGAVDDIVQVAERVRHEATVAFGRMKNIASRYKRHAFQCVGWFPIEGATDIAPGIVRIDNAIDQAGEWLPSATPEFRISATLRTHMSGGCVLNSIGVTPSPAEKNTILRLVRKSVKHRTSSPRMIVNVLASSMHWLSRRREPNSLVGRNLMAVCLPKKAVQQSLRGKDLLALTGPPTTNTVTFCYISEAGSATHFAPHFVLGKGSAVLDFQRRFLQPGES
jgi:hypothetical protein